jgi:hypothetical protein
MKVSTYTIAVHGGDNGDATIAGKEAMENIRLDLAPTPALVLKSALGNIGSGSLASQITGETAKGKNYKSVIRNLQRWAKGTTSPSAKTLEKYQQMYRDHHDGKDNPELKTLKDALESKGKPLPHGKMIVSINARFRVFTGRKKEGKVKVDDRVRVINAYIPDDALALAINDPYGVGLHTLDLTMPRFEISDVTEITVSYMPEE